MLCSSISLSQYLLLCLSNDVRVTVKRTHLHLLSHVVFLHLSVPASVAMSLLELVFCSTSHDFVYRVTHILHGFIRSPLTLASPLQTLSVWQWADACGKRS